MNFRLGRPTLLALGGTVLAGCLCACRAPRPTALTQTTTTSTAREAATTVTATTVTATTAASRRTTSAPPAPAGCRNSTEPKCGPFTWAPQPPPNQPLTVSVTATPAGPKAGQQVVFTVVFADADAGQPPAGCDNGGQTYGDGSPAQRLVCDDPSPCTWTGAHTPPPPLGGRWTVTYSHTYQHAGSFPAVFTGTSMTPDTEAHCIDAHTGRSGDPYASGGSGTITVTIAP